MAQCEIPLTIASRVFLNSCLKGLRPSTVTSDSFGQNNSPKHQEGCSLELLPGKLKEQFSLRLAWSAPHDKCRGEHKPVPNAVGSWIRGVFSSTASATWCPEGLMFSMWAMKDLKKTHPSNFEGSYSLGFPFSSQRKRRTK